MLGTVVSDKVPVTCCCSDLVLPPIFSLCADSTVIAEERKGEESSLWSLRNGDQFCVLSSQILWDRLGLAARFNFCSYLCSACSACNKF